MIRIEVTNEGDVTRMVAAFQILAVLRDSDYEIHLATSGPGGGSVRRCWRENGLRGGTSPTDWNSKLAEGTQQ